MVELTFNRRKHKRTTTIREGNQLQYKKKWKCGKSLIDIYTIELLEIFFMHIGYG